MSKRADLDPNKEVEKWKDAFYAEFKNLSAQPLGNYIEKKAGQILKEHNIRLSQYVVKRSKETPTRK